MKICVVSMFRNAVPYIERYFEQMDGLQQELTKRGHSLSLILGYGDSSDGTGGALYDECHHRFDTRLIEANHGGTHYGSIVHPQRFKQLAFVANKLWRQIAEDANVVAVIESDLIWKAEVFLNLLSVIESEENLFVAPMIFHLDERFYDTFCFRYNGVNFKNEKPYHKGLMTSQRFYEMNSVGSFVLMNAKIARQLQWPEEDVFIGFCRNSRLLGTKILLDKTQSVYHP